MTVTVNYGGVTCSAAAPTITASPTGVATEYGSTAQFNVSVKNNSSSGCASETFSLGAAAPTGWTKAFGTSAFTVSPGPAGLDDADARRARPYALGTYAVKITASSNASGKSASDTENVTVIEPANPLSLNISGAVR